MSHPSQRKRAAPAGLLISRVELKKPPRAARIESDRTAARGERERVKSATIVEGRGVARPPLLGASFVADRRTTVSSICLRVAGPLEIEFDWSAIEIEGPAARRVRALLRRDDARRRLESELLRQAKSSVYRCALWFLAARIAGESRKGDDDPGAKERPGHDPQERRP
jgi:hypothetical protein